MKTSVTAALGIALLLSACGTDTVVLPPPDVSVPKLKDTIPKDLGKCRAEPSSATVKADDPKTAATYINGLKFAGRDCRRKHAALWKLIEGVQ